ncbi:MAG: 6-phosphogluconolactonase [Elusimicrobiaceae bacterium]|nr:6-phosphogluconolactonase [Elusimicrobiaceae bacterium]
MPVKTFFNAIELKTFKNIETLSAGAADYILHSYNKGLKNEQTFSVALAGGVSPRWLYSLLAREPYRDLINWKKCRIFWTDERFVPLSSPHSNYRMAYDALLRAVPVALEHTFPVNTASKTPQLAAQGYEQRLKNYFGPRAKLPVFDLVILGIGADGHIASLFPYGDELQETGHWAVHTQSPDTFPAKDRITLTLPVLNNARHLLLFVSGERKYPVLKTLSSLDRPDPACPASLLNPKGAAFLYADKAALVAQS